MLSALAAPLSPQVEPAVGYGVGLLIAEWPDLAPYGFAGGRVDLYPGSFDDGWKIGASPWGHLSLSPAPTWSDDTSGAINVPYDLLEYGLDIVITKEGDAWMGGGRFGFSRVDLYGYEDGVLAVPLLGVQLDVARKIGPAFVDLGLRGAWGSQRQRVVEAGAEAAGEDWWSVGLMLSIGGKVTPVTRPE